jgi:hypothetical protein
MDDIEQRFFQQADSLGVTKSLSGTLRVQPPDKEPALRCTETSAEDVVESVEIPSPVLARDEPRRHLIVEVFEAIYARAIDLKDRLWCRHRGDYTAIGRLRGEGAGALAGADVRDVGDRKRADPGEQVSAEDDVSDRGGKQGECEFHLSDSMTRALSGAIAPNFTMHRTL